MRKDAIGRFVAATLIGALASVQHAAAQEAEAKPAAPALTLELNAMQPVQNGCRFTFMANNGLEGELRNAAFELVLFDRKGLVSRITVVDFKDLPHSKTKVRQFDFSSVDCAAVSRVLVNDATQCVGDGIEPGACIRNLRTESRSDVAFGS